MTIARRLVSTMEFGDGGGDEFGGDEGEGGGDRLRSGGGEGGDGDRGGEEEGEGEDF
jgi:hypothetical protein